MMFITTIIVWLSSCSCVGSYSLNAANAATEHHSAATTASSERHAASMEASLNVHAAEDAAALLPPETCPPAPHLEAQSTPSRPLDLWAWANAKEASLNAANNAGASMPCPVPHSAEASLREATNDASPRPAPNLEARSAPP